MTAYNSTTNYYSVLTMPFSPDRQPVALASINLDLHGSTASNDNNPLLRYDNGETELLAYPTRPVLYRH